MSRIPRSPRSPMSPRLRPPPTTIPESKIERTSMAFLVMSRRNMRALLPAAKNPEIRYLDLEENYITVDSLRDLPPRLTSLNLSLNPLGIAAIPKIDTLRSLSLDGCGLSSFKGLPHLPNLRFFSVKNNFIQSFKDCPFLPSLQNFDISGNSVEFDVILAIAALGSISLNRYNGIELTADDIKSAFMLSPIVGMALRDGMPATHSGDRDDLETNALRYLSDDFVTLINADFNCPCLIETQIQGALFIVLPWEVDSVKWYRDQQPDSAFRWLPVTPGEQKNNLPVTNLLRSHIIRAEVTIDGNSYNLYTKQPVLRNMNEPVLPFPLNLVISGTLTEGSMISVNPLPVPVTIRWMRDSTLINSSDTSITLTHEDVRHRITCYVTPFNDFIQFQSVFVQTDKVPPSMPVVWGLKFPQTIIENQSISFTSLFYPLPEGPSKISVERARLPSGTWSHSTDLDETKQFTPKFEDVGHYLRVVYTPITKEGIFGETVYFYSSSKVLPGVPTITSAVITGTFYAGYPLLVAANYVGGEKSEIHKKWIFEQPGRMGIECDLFTPTEEMIGQKVGVELTPIRSDMVIGQTITIWADQPIKKAQNSLRILSYDKVITAGRSVTLPEAVTFYITDSTTESGMRQVKTGLKYTPHSVSVGQTLIALSREAYGILGEIQAKRAKNQCVLKYSVPYVGETIETECQNPDDLIWVCQKNQGLKKVVAVGEVKYTIQPEDQGGNIFVIYGDKRTESTPTIQSRVLNIPEIKGKLIEGEVVEVDGETAEWYIENKLSSRGKSYTIKKGDVGKLVKALVVKDGVSLAATAKTPVEPSIPEVSLKGLSEGTTFEIPDIGKYFSVKWLIKREDRFEEVATGNSYTPTFEDIGKLVKLEFVRKSNNQSVFSDEVTVLPGIPCVEDVRLRQAADGSLEVTSKYRGGTEGVSRLTWREKGKKNIFKPDGNFPTEKMIGKVIEVGYRPVRDDGLTGKTVYSNAIEIKPKPRILSADVLSSSTTLICQATSDIGSIKYRWIRNGLEVGKGKSVEKTGGTYVCEVYAECNGIVSEVSSIGPFEIKQTQKIEIVGESIAGQMLTTNKGKLVTWQREEKGIWQPVTEGREYVLTANDIGCRMRVCTNRSEVSKPTKPVTMTDSLSAAVKSSARRGIGKARVWDEGVFWDIEMKENGFAMKGKLGGKRIAKWADVSCRAIDGTVDEVEIALDASTRYKLKVSLDGEERVRALIGEDNARDYLVSLFSLLKNKFE